MKSIPLISGLFATFALAWAGITMVPQAQLGKLQPQIEDEGADVYPINTGGIAEQGRKVYVSYGCATCHTQAVRDGHSGPDLDRKWGNRRTVARDYIYDYPVLLGSVRNGPDLSNISTRMADATWHYKHLYNPRSVSPGSIMPPFPFLFEKHKIAGQPSADALTLTGEDAAAAGYEIVPSAEAKALVGYLLSLNHTHALKEVKEMIKEAPAK